MKLVIEKPSEPVEDFIMNTNEMQLLSYNYAFDKNITDEINQNIFKKIKVNLNFYRKNALYGDVKDWKNFEEKLKEFCASGRKLIEYFDKIEISCDNVDTFEQVKNIIPSTNVSIIINIKSLSLEYIQNNLKNINKLLSAKCPNVSYIIKCSLDLFDSCGEDISASCDDILNATQQILSIKNEILKYNLSPFEQIMYAYDIVRSRKYKKSTENYTASRDTIKILNSDNIVCLGYSKLFETILTELNINVETIKLNYIGMKVGHARNLVTVIDPKYNLNHILVFDTTFDSNKMDDNSYLKKYKFFARTLSAFEKSENAKIDGQEEYNISIMKKTISLLSETNKLEAANLIHLIKNPWKRINIDKYLKENPLDSKYNKEIEKILSNDSFLYVIFPCFNHEIVEILKDFYKVTVEMLNRKVPIESFAKCLYQVRRIEAYKDPSVYSFDIDELIEIVDDYYMSENELEPSLNEQQSQLFKQLMLKRKSMEQTVIESIQELECISKISDNDKIEKDIKRIYLLNKLKELNELLRKNDIADNSKVKDAVKLIKK